MRFKTKYKAFKIALEVLLILMVINNVVWAHFYQKIEKKMVLLDFKTNEFAKGYYLCYEDLKHAKLIMVEHGIDVRD